MAKKDEELELELEEQKDGSVVINPDEDNEDRDDKVVDEEDPEELDGDIEEEREKIREARRQERKLKKERDTQRLMSLNNKIQKLERQNQELAAYMQGVHGQTKIAQIDKGIEDSWTKHEFEKTLAQRAHEAGDIEGFMNHMKEAYKAETNAENLSSHRQQLAAGRGQQGATQQQRKGPDPSVQKNLKAWHTKNSWFDPSGKDSDSRVAKTIDEALVEEGYDPSDPEYFEELDSRLKSYLPHRYAGAGKNRNRPGGVSSGRVADSSGAVPRGYVLDAERVKALKDAGMWDDPKKRAEMVKEFIKYDRENGKK